MLESSINISILISATKTNEEKWFFYQIEKEKFKGYQFLEDPYLNIAISFDYCDHININIENIMFNFTFNRLYNLLKHILEKNNGLNCVYGDFNYYSNTYTIRLLFQNFGDFQYIYNKLKYLFNTTHFRYLNQKTLCYLHKDKINMEIKKIKAKETLNEFAIMWRNYAYSPSGPMFKRIVKKKFQK
jgi:hypothetical protein